MQSESAEFQRRLDEFLDWVRDGDSMYLGARACLLRGLENPAHVLTHAALERYFKGLLRFEHPVRFSVAELKSHKFGHDLVALLNELRDRHPALHDDRLQEDCKILTNESQRGRYLVTADRGLLTAETHVQALMAFMRSGRLDWAVCTVRNEILEKIPARLRSSLLLAQVEKGDTFRSGHLVAEHNPAFTSFRGL